MIQIPTQEKSDQEAMGLNEAQTGFEHGYWSDNTVNLMDILDFGPLRQYRREGFDGHFPLSTEEISDCFDIPLSECRAAIQTGLLEYSTGHPARLAAVPMHSVMDAMNFSVRRELGISDAHMFEKVFELDAVYGTILFCLEDPSCSPITTPSELKIFVVMACSLLTVLKYVFDNNLMEKGFDKISIASPVVREFSPETALDPSFCTNIATRFPIAKTLFRGASESGWFAMVDQTEASG